MEDTIRIFYLRNEEGFPIATVATELQLGNFSGEVTGVYYGIACWNPKDKFNKALSREIAIGRLRLKYGYIRTDEGFKRAVINDIAYGSFVPNRVAKAAQRWLATPRTEFVEQGYPSNEV